MTSKRRLSCRRATMPTGPKGQRRPADVIGNAIRVAQIATGEAEEEFVAKPEKDEAAAAMGRKGGAARANASRERQTLRRKDIVIRYVAVVRCMPGSCFSRFTT